MRAWEDIDKKQTAVSKEESSLVDALSFLEAARIKKGISQAAFANKIGMTQPQLAKIEGLESMPTPAMPNKYAEGLGLQSILSNTN